MDYVILYLPTGEVLRSIFCPPNKPKIFNSLDAAKHALNNRVIYYRSPCNNYTVYVSTIDMHPTATGKVPPYLLMIEGAENYV